MATGGINQDHTYYLWPMSHIVKAGFGDVQPMESFTDDPGYPLNDLIFTPDGQWLAGGGFNSVILRHLATGQIRHLTGHDGPVLSLAISPAGTRLASGSFDETVVVWDLASGQPLLTLPEHRMGAASLIFSPDGRWLITGDQHGAIRGWAVETGALRQNIEGRGTDLALNPGGTLLAFKKTLDDVVIYDIFNARETIQVKGERPLIFSPDGHLLAVGSDEGIITLWGVQ